MMGVVGVSVDAVVKFGMLRPLSERQNQKAPVRSPGMVTQKSPISAVVRSAI